MKISIRSKLMWAFCFLMLLVFISQLVFNLFFAKFYYASYKAVVIEETFYDIKAVYNGEVESILDIILSIENTHAIKITVANKEEIIYSSEKDAVEKGFPQSRGGRFYNDEMTFSTTPRATIRDIPNEISLMRLAGTFQHEKEEIFVSITLPVVSIDSSVEFFTKSNTIISLGVLLIGIIFSVFVSKSITRPIAEIEEVSKKLSQLDFSHNANENIPTKELSSLAININSMSAQLETSISKLQRANAKLQKDIDYQKQIEQMRREFVANVSHEMKTPLSLLQIYSENLKYNVEGIDRDYYCDTIIEETNHLSNMVKSMLDLSSIDNGLCKMNFYPIDFSELCLETLNKTAPIMKDYVVSISIEEGIRVVGDYNFLEQAIKNYISNAISHTAKGDKIDVELRKASTNVEFSIWNEGKAIDSEIIPRIWDSFYKSDQARTRTIDGNVGLGLSIVKTIIEKHEGRYLVVNERGGVKFSFCLPLMTVLN